MAERYQVGLSVVPRIQPQVVNVQPLCRLTEGTTVPIPLQYNRANLAIRAGAVYLFPACQTVPVTRIALAEHDPRMAAVPALVAAILNGR